MTEKDKAEVGDLIKIDDDLCLVVDKTIWDSDFCKNELAVVILDFPENIRLAIGFQIEFENGDYEIVAKRGKWKIAIIGDKDE